MAQSESVRLVLGSTLDWFCVLPLKVQAGCGFYPSLVLGSTPVYWGPPPEGLVWFWGLPQSGSGVYPLKVQSGLPLGSLGGRTTI